MHVAKEMFKTAEHIVNTCDRLVLLNSQETHVRYDNSHLIVDAEVEARKKFAKKFRIMCTIMKVVENGFIYSVRLSREDVVGNKLDILANDKFSLGILETFIEHYREGETHMITPYEFHPDSKMIDLKSAFAEDENQYI